MSSGKIPAFAGKAYQSMRNNDFSTEAAIAEVIDNSIQSESKNIRIKIFKHKPKGKAKERVNEIIFGDDGIGMDKNTIQYALQVGWSSRYNDRKSLGRFGVGMTYAAISVCEFVEIYSRQKGGNWLYTFLDIGERDDDKEPGIEPVIEKSPPKEFLPLVGDYGTLVIWKDIDRIGSDFDIDNFEHWLGRTYRKFIGKRIIKNKKIIDNTDQRNIFLEVEGGENVKISAFDPMYVIPEQFHIEPENESSILRDDQEFRFDIDEVDAPPEGETEGIITIRTSLTPKSWRKESKVSGGSKKNELRRVKENEGISLLRAGREVAYRRISDFRNSNRTHDRFWSCEIEFEPILDHNFSVKNIKVGAKPIGDLKTRIVDTLGPKINSFIKEIEKDWSTEKIKSHEGETGSIGKHSETEKIIQEVAKPMETELSLEEQTKRAEEFVKEKKFKDQESIAFLEKILDPSGPPFIIEEDANGRRDGPFIDIIPTLGKKVITYNLRHAFFESVFDKLNEVKKSAEEVDPKNTKLINIANGLKDDLDYLIYAFADCKYDISGNRGKNSENVDHTLEDVEIGWSDKLRRVYRKNE